MSPFAALESGVRARYWDQLECAETKVDDAPVKSGASPLRRVRRGRHDHVSTAGCNQLTSAQVEFVTPGMAAEVVAALQNEHSGVGLRLAKKIGGCQSAHPGADHDEIVVLVEILGRGYGLSIAQRMRRPHGSRNLAAYPLKRGWIVGSARRS